MSERIRLTITVPPETHAVFAGMAEAAGVSLGRAMGDWLTDTAGAARVVSRRVLEARLAPALALEVLEDEAPTDVLADLAVDAFQEREELRAEAGGSPLSAKRRGRGAQKPPSSPTGVNSSKPKRKAA